MAEANRWTDPEAIGAPPVCLSGHALEEFQAAPRELKTQVVNRRAPTLRALFEHLDQVMGVTRNDRAGRNEFKSLVQKESEPLREFARRVRNLGLLVFGHQEADQRDELFRERFLDGLSDSDLLGVLLRERTRGFVGTVDRAGNSSREVLNIADKAADRFAVSLASPIVVPRSQLGGINPEVKHVHQVAVMTCTSLTDDFNLLFRSRERMVEDINWVKSAVGRGDGRRKPPSETNGGALESSNCRRERRRPCDAR